MWKCPKCGKEFKKTAQSHYCGEKPKTIEEYIFRQDAEKQGDLLAMRQVLHEALPETEERISWSMPTYWEKTDKGTIRIPYGAVDKTLIHKIARWCLETGNHAL